GTPNTVTNVTAEKNIVTEVVTGIFLGAKRKTNPAATPQNPPKAIPRMNRPNMKKDKIIKKFC
ncbi:hypothetical protein AB7187_20660, partial [Providencia rettgeri]